MAWKNNFQPYNGCTCRHLQLHPSLSRIGNSHTNPLSLQPVHQHPSCRDDLDNHHFLQFWPFCTIQGRLVAWMECSWWSFVACLPTLKIFSHILKSNEGQPIVRTSLPKMIGISWSSTISRTIKWTGKMKSPTLMSTSSTTPRGYFIDLSNSWRVIDVLFGSPNLLSCKCSSTSY